MQCFVTMGSGDCIFYFELFLKNKMKYLKLIIPIVFVLLLLLSYKIVSKINHKKK
jgi:hypothetical protein